MANLQKFTRNGAKSYGNILSHYERKIDSKTGDYIHFRNRDIDHDRTHLNYNLGPSREITQSQFMRNKLNELYCLNRADVKVLCDWVITKPTDLKEEDTQKFFEASYSFLKEKFCPHLGYEAIVSSYVHMDETTPHMHFAFIPAVPDEKHGGYKISSDKLTSREVLLKTHPEFQKYIEEKGLECTVQSFITKEGNKTIEELKVQTAKTKLANEKYLESKIKLEEQLLKKAEIEGISISKSLTGGVKGLTYEDAVKLLEMAKWAYNYDYNIEKYLKKIATLKNENEKLRDTLEREIHGKNISIETLEYNFDVATKRIKELKEKIYKLPKEIQKEYFKKEYLQHINRELER